MYQGLLRLLLGKVLGSPETKKRIFEALRFQAQKTETKLDDAGVDVFAEVWDVVIPIILGKI